MDVAGAFCSAGDLVAGVMVGQALSPANWRLPAPACTGGKIAGATTNAAAA
jgi:hypothetical protein